ncbi:MAG: hypothetical protein R2753_10630 [Chitinophagales bacterium]
MSVLKNLRGIFFTEEEPKEEKETSSKETKSTTQATNTSSSNTTDTTTTVNTSESQGTKDDKIIDTLFQAIESNNLNGFDYLEFKRSVKGLEKMVADEATRFKSAFATASTIGITMEKLVETADYYAKVLDKEKSQFIKAAKDQSEHLIDNRKKELQHLLKSLEDKKKMIDEMQNDLLKGEERIKQIQDGIKSATVNIENTKKNFETSWSFLKEQIVTDIEKIKTYLK